MEATLSFIFCFVDDLCKIFEPTLNLRLICSQLKKRNRASKLHLSEIITILICFHFSHFRNFKAYYSYLLFYHKKEFPKLVSYERFVCLSKQANLPMAILLEFIKGSSTENNFADSTSLAVCKNKRIFNHKVFKGLAQRGKNSMGFFYGFKLHLLVNEIGQVVKYKLTKGNMDDRKSLLRMLINFKGKIYADKAYIGKEFFQTLYQKGVHIITSLRSNMKPQIMTLKDSKNLNRRNFIESIFNILKNKFQLEHTRHRSPINFVANILSCLSAYSLKFFMHKLLKAC